MRLIDADALIKEACAEGAYGYVDAKQIADAPTVDAAPVRHGHWIRVSLIGVFECSECGNQITVADSKFAKEVCKWCLHCGAKMDEGDDGEVN